MIEDNVLSAGHANYLAAINVHDGMVGVAIVEASTGEFTGTEVPEEDLAAELERWSPREMVVPERTAAEDLPKFVPPSVPLRAGPSSPRRRAGADAPLRGL